MGWRTTDAIHSEFTPQLPPWGRNIKYHLLVYLFIFKMSVDVSWSL
jgi:hypothetical protein